MQSLTCSDADEISKECGPVYVEEGGPANVKKGVEWKQCQQMYRAQEKNIPPDNGRLEVKFAQLLCLGRWKVHCQWEEGIYMGLTFKWQSLKSGQLIDRFSGDHFTETIEAIETHTQAFIDCSWVVSESAQSVTANWGDCLNCHHLLWGPTSRQANVIVNIVHKNANKKRKLVYSASLITHSIRKTRFVIQILLFLIANHKLL